MSTTRPGLVPIALLSLGMLGAAVIGVGYGAVRGPVSRDVAEQGPRAAPARDAGRQAADPSMAAEAGTDPSIPSIFTPGPAPRMPEGRVRHGPRLKPNPARAPAQKARPASPLRAAPDTPVGITAARDLDGGRSDRSARASALFSDHADLLSAAREEAGYEALVVAAGDGAIATLLRGGYDRVDAEAAVLAASGVADLAPLGHGDAVEAAGRPALVTASEVAAGAAPRRLDRLRLRPAPGVTVAAWRGEDGWQARREEAVVAVRYSTASTVITDSLFGAGARAGVPAEVLARTANLFLYDVDFARDVRRGDRFEVVYEALYDQDGRAVGTGEVVFAAMTWRGGREARAYYRYEAPEAEAAYFDASGESARRLLMKTPIDGARVTSRFGPRRHPTLGYRKDHRGVDFGARTGTPVMAAGDGVVLRANRFGSFGNYLRIRHANGYETAYAHLHGFADGVKRGARVRQGDVVAYVGSTGRSTGPHLHYEVHREGTPLNPMALDMKGGEVLAGEALVAFEGQAATLEAMRAWPHAVTAVASGD